MTCCQSGLQSPCRSDVKARLGSRQKGRRRPAGPHSFWTLGPPDPERGDSAQSGRSAAGNRRPLPASPAARGARGGEEAAEQVAVGASEWPPAISTRVPSSFPGFLAVSLREVFNGFSKQGGGLGSIRNWSPFTLPGPVTSPCCRGHAPRTALRWHC